jgi:phenylacetate-CoA ligase
MNSIKKTPLENWIRQKIGLEASADLTPSELARYQLARLNQTLDNARHHSPFYQERFADLPAEPLSLLEDLRRLTFTTADDLSQKHLQMLCVSQSEIARVVTLPSFNESEPARRLYFTEDDLEHTADFFHHGMSTFVEPGQKVLILMPGPAPGSIGDLLVRGLERMNVRGIVHGPVMDIDRAIDDVLNLEIDCLVGIPVQVLAMARHAGDPMIPKGRIKNVLLSTDYVPDAIIRELETSWDCRVFEHYGMTEMVFGGAVQCEARSGYHMREADLYFEIVDPVRGHSVPDGEIGEIVFTTLTRIGMPLIRYRTGDLSRFIPEPCPCGSSLRRLDKIAGRIASAACLAGSFPLDISTLDEAIFQTPDVMDYVPEITKQGERECLTVKVSPTIENDESVLAEVQQSIECVPVIKDLLFKNLLMINIKMAETEPKPSTGREIRKIMDYRRELC